MIISGSSQFTNYSNANSNQSRSATFEQKNDQNKSAEKSSEQTNNTQSSESQGVFDSTSTSELIPLLQSPKQLDSAVDRQAMTYYSKASISLYENNQNPAQSAGSARMVIDENGQTAQVYGIDTMV